MSDTNKALERLGLVVPNTSEVALARFMHDSALVVLFQYIGKCEMQRLLHFINHLYPDVFRRAMATKPSRKYHRLGEQKGLGDMLATIVGERFGLSSKLPTSRVIPNAMDFTRPVCRGIGNDGSGCNLRLNYDSEVSTAAQRVWGAGGYQMCSPCFLKRYRNYFIPAFKIENDQDFNAIYHKAAWIYRESGMPNLLVKRQYMFLPWLDAILTFMNDVQISRWECLQTQRDALRLCRAVNKTLVPYEGEGLAVLPSIASYKENIPVHILQSIGAHLHLH